MIYDDIINNNAIVIIAYEGRGAYQGEPQDNDFHPKGRMGAKFQAYLNSQLVYTTGDGSTLPDSLSNYYVTNFNDGWKIPTIEQAVFDIYATYHHGKRAFKVGNPNADVFRDDNRHFSSGILIHQRTRDDKKSFATSVGCLGLRVEALNDMILALNIRT